MKRLSPWTVDIAWVVSTVPYNRQIGVVTCHQQLRPAPVNAIDTFECHRGVFGTKNCFVGFWDHIDRVLFRSK